jgi:hypothetical protein
MKNAPNLALSLLARQWGATALPFSEPSAQAWLETPQSQRALALLDQTATLRSVLLLAGPNGVGKSALVGRWLTRLDRRLFCPLLLTHASLSGCGLLSALASRLSGARINRRGRSCWTVSSRRERSVGVSNRSEGTVMTSTGSESKGTCAAAVLKPESARAKTTSVLRA